MNVLSTLAMMVVCSAINLVPNGDFEARLQNWGSLWTRDAGVGSLQIDSDTVHSGNYAIRIEHRGSQDWSLTPNQKISVKEGDFFSLEAWMKLEGEGSAEICVVTYDQGNQVIDWSYAEQSTRETRDWVHLKSRFFVPQGVAVIHPRTIGYGTATVWVDDFSLTREGNIDEFRGDLPDTLNLKNEAIELTLAVNEGTFTVTDSRIGQTWKQSIYQQDLVLKSATLLDRRMETAWFYAPTGEDVTIAFEMDESRPEFVIHLTGEGALPRALPFPQPFVTQSGTYLVIPMNEGISYPVEDSSIDPMRLVAYGGHGICMPFWGVTDGTQGMMVILETPNDVSIRVARLNDRLCVIPEWESEKGQFGYARKIRYSFLDRGGHVAICKRYRGYAQETGLLKTLAQKREEIPSVDRLVGAVNIWCWDGALNYIQEMKSLGIDRILWSHRETPSTIETLNDLGVLTSRYDIYQDLMDPENFQYLNGVHSDWTTAGWPQDIMLDEDGNWRKGWEVKGKNGKWYACGVLCDKQALPYARERISEELKTHAYHSRFIDTTTASPWRECYHPDHPLTRRESRFWKMELLRLVSEEMGLVCGSETGHDAAVPFVHYFEGMLSLGPYRVPDSGRNIQQIWDDTPERVVKFQMGHAYRLPLWELVYHDCVVAQWYWGDYNNKLPSLWDKRDLFNVLYGTPPMFMFNKDIWQKNKERFIQSYQNTCPIVREVGYAEMVDHRFLTPDRTVQQTLFANGVQITVNFGDTPYAMKDQESLSPMSYHIARDVSLDCVDWQQR